jgi:hypothetical protein
VVEPAPEGGGRSLQSRSAVQETLFRQLLKQQQDQLAACTADAPGAVPQSADEVAAAQARTERLVAEARAAASQADSQRTEHVLLERGAMHARPASASAATASGGREGEGAAFLAHAAPSLAKRAHALRRFQHAASVVMIRRVVALC